MEKIDGKKYRIFPGQTDPLQEFDFFSRTFLPDGTDYEEYNSTAEVVSKIIDENKYDVPALPASGLLTEGELYTWEGIVVRVRQTHNRTIYDPTDTPALFSVYRKETSDMLWIEGEQVDVGTLRTYNNVVYECIQAHQTQADWTPDATPALWQVYEEPGGEYEVWVQPAGAHDAYNIDDIVWFPTEGSTLYKSLINANVWSPTVYPAGWEVYTP